MVSEVKDFQKDVLESKKPVIVDFWAEWCGPCKMLGPIFERAADALKGKVTFLKVNVDENQQLAAENGVRGIPCMVIYKDGEEVDRIVGVVPEEQLKERIESAV